MNQDGSYHYPTPRNPHRPGSILAGLALMALGLVAIGAGVLWMVAILAEWMLGR